MKHLAILAAAGSLAFFGVSAQAADLPAAPAASIAFAGFSEASYPVSSVAEYDRDDKYDRRRWRGRDRDYRHDDRGRRYNNDRHYDHERRLSHSDRVWRGNDGRYRCRRDDGTVGLVIGAGVGALLGREVDNRGDRALGTIIGAVGGGLLGREVDRGGARCR